jgi:A/G-specific adenine glycosylase
LKTRVQPASLEEGEETNPELASDLTGDSPLSQDAVFQGSAAGGFRRRLMNWYRQHARALPWRDTTDPYRIWVSEVMLQQTRVAAVVEHYTEFLRRFPTLVALALASEPDVLAAWSGLGYYRRARMLHKAARFIVLERNGALPAGSAELRTLPGIGDYTAAAIASIAFGESIGVVDGNVERVILRLTGRAEEKSAELKTFVRIQAQALVPARRIIDAPGISASDRRATSSAWSTTERLAIAAAAHPEKPAGEPQPSEDSPSNRTLEDAELTGEVLPGRSPRVNAAGDHNQAMMELGATICLPRAPLCLHCPVHVLCRTRGEHPTPPRAPQLSRPVAFLLQTRKSGVATEVLLERRASEASLMPGMFELPPLPLDAVEGREPILRVRHAITGTNYYVQIYTGAAHGSAVARRVDASQLRKAIPASKADLHWLPASRLPMIPLTGLARKVLHRLRVMQGPDIELLK